MDNILVCLGYLLFTAENIKQKKSDTFFKAFWEKLRIPLNISHCQVTDSLVSFVHLLNKIFCRMPNMHEWVFSFRWFYFDSFCSFGTYILLEKLENISGNKELHYVKNAVENRSQPGLSNFRDHSAIYPFISKYYSQNILQQDQAWKYHTTLIP